jgi:Cu2+-exporting ATPase
VLAWAGSVYGQLTGGAVWFDTVSIFIALMLGGRFLQQRTLARSRDQVLADDGAEHMRARRVAGGAIELVAVKTLRTGDELLLAPGDLVPVRARLLGEGTSFSLDWINGESEPREFAAGAEVPAGAFHSGRSTCASRRWRTTGARVWRSCSRRIRPTARTRMAACVSGTC